MAFIKAMAYFFYLKKYLKNFCKSRRKIKRHVEYNRRENRMQFHNAECVKIQLFYGGENNEKENDGIGFSEVQK
jgi:hypothetical protein